MREQGTVGEILWWKARGDADVQIVRYFHSVACSVRSFPQDDRSSKESSVKTNDWRNRERVVLDLLSNLGWVKISVVAFGEPLGHMITLRGQILVSGTGDDLLPPPPCVHPKRLRVYIQDVPL